MKLQKIFKVIKFVLPIVLFFSGFLFLSANFAQFIVNVHNINLTLNSIESSTTDFSVSFDPPFTFYEGEASYIIVPRFHCNEYNENWECIDSIPNLCPYIALEPKNGEITEIGFTKNPFGFSASGELNSPVDENDNWSLSVSSPCFEGECPSDYNPYESGEPLPQSLKGQVFKCELSVETNEIPPLVKNYLKQNIAYADTLFNVVEVSAVLTGEIPGCIENCFSNVFFLPGLMGSRLYNSTDDELWVSISDSNHANLALDSQGKSINSDIHTKNDTQKLEGDGDETGIVDDIFSFNIYQSFINDLKNWKQDGTITDYAFIPYDWRLSLDDIITNGSASLDGNLSYDQTQDFSESFILKKLEELQASSKSGKITIIAHSNGGLVAKALVQKLKDTDNPLYDKIDKIIFIAVPQIGTPDAILALLHGTELGYGFIMGKNRSRQLSENMPTIYNLLPSASYFSTVDPVFAVDKLVSFENTSFFDPQTSQYGIYVSDETELENYILGTDGRIKPSFDDTVHPNIGNATLYSEAESVHQILDSWQPSPNTKVIQVAGWGEETIAGISYKTYLNPGGFERLSYEINTVIDGDSVVVTLSALWMSDSVPNVERWWVDLKGYNNQKLFDTKHRDILEIPNLRNFINSEIEDLTFTDPNNIVVNNTSTLTSNSTRLHYTLHSPLTIGITDTQGRYTGQDPVTKEIKEEIPGVNYRQIGDVQFISAPADIAYTVKIQGYEQGEFSLDVDRQEGNEITDSTSFQAVPSSSTTIATIDVTPDFEVSSSALEIDQNGDGAVDKTLNATPDGITVYDTTPPELQIAFNINTKDVIFSAQDILDPNPTILATDTSITLTDNAGNTTIIPFKKLRELPTRLRFTYDKIIRNGVVVAVPNTNIVYNWQDKKGVLTDLDTRITVKGVEKYVFNYKKVKNATIIKEKTNGNVVLMTTKPGFVVVTIKTEGDSIKINY